MAEDVQAHVTADHQHEGEQVRPPGVDHGGGDHDTERLEQGRRDGDDVRERRRVGRARGWVDVRFSL